MRAIHPVIQQRPNVLQEHQQTIAAMTGRLQQLKTRFQSANG